MVWHCQATIHCLVQCWHQVNILSCHWLKVDNDWQISLHGPLARYVKIRVAHAPGMPGTFSPAANFRGNYYIAIPACITARAWRTCRDACRDRLPAVTGKTFPAFPAHAQPQFCVSGKRPIDKMIVSFSLKKILFMTKVSRFRCVDVP